MAKPFSIKNSHVAVFITLMVFISLGACYFFIYVPGNEKVVQERYFRCMQNVATNIQIKMDNSLSQVDSLFNVDTTSQKADLAKYINHYPRTNFTLIPVQTIPVKWKNKKPLDTSGTYIKIDTNAKQLSLFVSRAILNDTLHRTRMGIRYGIPQFIKPLLPAENFENYIVFSGKWPIYETFPSGLNYTRRDSILQSKNGLVSPGVHTHNIGGKDYVVFSQPVKVANEEWIVVGLVLDSNYQKEKNQLPIGIVLLLLTVAIGIIISLPWIKLYHMGSKDKLAITDGVASVLVSMLLMSLLFFVIFKYSLYFSSSYEKIYDSRNKLPARIIKAFENDVDTARKVLDIYNLEHNKLSVNITRLGSSRAAPIKSSMLTKDDTLCLQRGLARDIEVHQVYWLNKNGQELENWTTDNINAPHVNFGSRDYFKKTISNKPNVNGTGYYLDQVVSRTSGVFTSIIAKKTNDSTVAAMSFTAKSLENVILPDGYLFAVIDSTGEVLYHSVTNRNLNENILKEFADSSQMVSALASKSDTSFIAEYYGRQQDIKIKPFTSLPYFILIFKDVAYTDARDTESYSFTITMLSCLLLFMVLQVGVVFFVSTKRSLLKKKNFETWTGPKISSHRQYNLAILANTSILIMLVLFFNLNSFFRYLYILLFSVTLISIFLNGIFAAKYHKDRKFDYRDFKLVAIYWLCAFVVVIDISAGYVLSTANFLWLLCFELILTAVCYGIYNWRAPILTGARKFSLHYPKLKFRWTYTKSFALMATTRLIITSGIPVAFFFIYSFNYEQNLDTRYRQYNFAKDVTQKYNTADIIDNNKNSVKNLSGTYCDGVSVNHIDLAATKPNTAYTYEDAVTVKLLSAFRLINNTLELKSDDINAPSVTDKAFFNNITQEKTCNKTTTWYKMGQSGFIRIIATDISYPHLVPWFWLMLFVSIVIFYFIIHNIVKKLFSLNLPDTGGWKVMDDKLLADNTLNKLLFVLGSPGSGKLKMIKQKLIQNRFTDQQEDELRILKEEDRTGNFKETLSRFKAGKLLGNKGELLTYYDDENQWKNNVFIADMILICAEDGETSDGWKKCREEALKDNYALVIINHFEYNIKDPKANSVKLAFLETLMQKGASKIIIISTVHPLTFLDSFNEQQTTGEAGKESTGIPESELERWHVLLGHFRIAIEPLDDITETDKPERLIPHTNPLEKAVFEETKYSHYLNDMYKMTMDTAHIIKNGNSDEASDPVVFKLQITSHYFYTYIWQSLTKEEKFLLYDLAEDGLVNPYDDYNLSMLLSKGLIIKPDGTLKLFNRGFRNFILTAIGNTEVNRIKAQVKDNGNWGNLKTPLIITMLAILLFLIASQQEAYSKIITYVTALGAGVPAILKIFSLFPNGTQKTQ